MCIIGVLSQNGFEFVLRLAVAVQLPQVGGQISSRSEVGGSQVHGLPEDGGGFVQFLVHRKQGPQSAEKFGVVGFDFHGLAQFVLRASQVSGLGKLNSQVGVSLRTIRLA